MSGRLPGVAGQLGILVAGVLLWFFVIAPLTEMGSGRLTVYRVRTRPGGDVQALDRMRFRVWPPSRVQQERPGNRDLRDCQITDRLNWRCEADGVAVARGQLQPPAGTPPASDVRQVSRLAWYRALLF